jgi:predicted CoA-binding protein
MQETSIVNLLRAAKTIAVVGLSPKNTRASNEVANYMQQHGYRILPVNPSQAGTIILGELCYASLADAVTATGLKIDIVNCFRKSEDIPPIVDEAIIVGAHGLWMQLAITNTAAATRAQAAGIQVIMDKCIKIEHMQLFAGQHRY